jgi:DNA polymerase zeta
MTDRETHLVELVTDRGVPAGSDWWNDLQEKSVAREKNGLGRPFRSKRYFSQIDGPTPKNKHGFAYTQKNKSTSVEHEVQYMSTMSVEVHVNTRGKFVPNPEQDEVQCIFWSVKSDETALNSQSPEDSIQSGILVLCVEDMVLERIRKQATGQVIAESTELDLMVRLVEIVRSNDPDVLTGYEVHGGSWGFLIERARVKYDFNLCDEFSRMKTESYGRFGKESDRWGFNTTSTIRVTGRHMINIWRAMRGELNLLQYTMENVVWHLLHRRIPHYAWRTLTAWYCSGKTGDLGRLLQYYQIRTRLDLEILEANELIPRTSEQARLLGVDFFSVFSRGSQFKVESIMFRIAKPENLMLVSPNRKQVGGQNALECLPLVMEPQSAFYNSPLLVLDFQSLYPSVMIAYNYCYSTFLGRITDWRGMNKMGFTEYKRQQGLLALLQDHINIAPNGMMYVKTEIRKSLLAKMLTEILETRVMVKSGMKKDKDDKTLQQLLNNRQLALKLLANVTYGYTSASFSGRMPCSEIADSIVQTGRETLERAIAHIHSVEKWGAEVVYGDTDSLFVYLKGRTRDQAFDIGNEIAKAITDMNPRPIKLKFEKVYHPCVLLAKKRYVGYKYESKDQAQPEFDAKGIETVRRDGTPAEQKIEEKVLKMLFETADLSQIKRYFQSQCEKIMRGNVSIQDFCFAREVRLGTYSDKGPPPAGALISTRKMLQDARAEPQYGERVPYVVITGAPGARLIDRCVAPEDLLENPHWRLDAQYYISKNLIPPLERIFNLVGANVRQWYDEMPKIQRIHHVFPAGGPNGAKKYTLEAYLRSTHCVVCSRRFKQGGNNQLCPRCRKNVPGSLTKLQTRLQTEERKYEEDLSICRSCSGLMPLEEVKCDSKDCPVFWRRMRQLGKVRRERGLVVPAINSLLEGVERRALEW